MKHVLNRYFLITLKELKEQESSTFLFIWRIQGEFNYYSFVSVAGFFGGLSIFIEDSKRRGFPVATFLYLTLDTVFRTLEGEGYLTKTKLFETVVFTISSTALLYLLRIAKHQNTYLWIFTPPQCNIIMSRSCPHNGSCWKDIVLSGIKYFSFGVAIQWLQSLISEVQNVSNQPLKTLKLQSKHIRTGIFIGLYITVYKIVSCLLCQTLGFDSPWHAIPSGLVAGAVYLLRPDFTVTAIAFTNLLMVAEQHFRMVGQLPKWPFREITFAICASYLYHSRFYYPSYIPSNVIKLMNAYTNGNSDVIYSRLLKLVDKVI
ncbi:transmembrane protein 135-like isoform X2 [Lycorma delicatula]|uniref:transmembrane protein 135-like isoform X2 n=1 Tax=Lycorma delicatula TaxID=130591 RepID=UPI003F51A639